MSRQRRETSSLSRASSQDESDDASLAVDMDGDSTKGGESGVNAENMNLRNESRKTSVIRCLVITALLTTAAIVANVALIVALIGQEADFKKEYSRLGNRVIEQFLEEFANKIVAADSMVSQVYFKKDDNAPYLTSIPEFEILADGVRKLASSMIIVYAPILKGQQERQIFEAYADLAFDPAARSKFKSDYLPLGGNCNLGTDPLVSYVETGNRTIEQGIYRVEDGMVVTDHSSTVYAPIWQVCFFF